MIAAELLPAIFDIARILADQFGFELGDQANDRARAGVGVGLAIARQSLVGVDPHQRRVAVVGDDGGLDVHDLHTRSSQSRDLTAPHATFLQPLGSNRDLLPDAEFVRALPAADLSDEYISV